MLRLTLGILLILSAGCGMVQAQRPVPAPHLPSTTEPVPSGPITLNVVVTDKSGHPVSNLQQSDFTLLDEGQPTPMRAFVAHNLQGPGMSPTAPETAVIVLDDVNANFNVISLERGQIDQFLRANNGKLSLPVSLVWLTDEGLRPIADASTDGIALDKQLQHERGQLHTLPRAGFWGGSDRFGISLSALDSLASFEARQPGRKLIIWISPGWWLFDNPNIILSSQDQSRFFNIFVHLSTVLQRGQVTLDAVDPLGTWDAGHMRTFLWESFLKPVRKPSQAQPGNLALQVLSSESGGQVLNSSNDIRGEITRCIDDATAWYSITFDPRLADTPDAWHSIQVRLDKPGLKVRTSNGYYAQPAQ